MFGVVVARPRERGRGRRGPAPARWTGNVVWPWWVLHPVLDASGEGEHNGRAGNVRCDRVSPARTGTGGSSSFIF